MTTVRSAARVMIRISSSGIGFQSAAIGSEGDGACADTGVASTMTHNRIRPRFMRFPFLHTGLQGHWVTFNHEGEWPQTHPSPAKSKHLAALRFAKCKIL